MKVQVTYMCPDCTETHTTFYEEEVVEIMKRSLREDLSWDDLMKVVGPLNVIDGLERPSFDLFENDDEFLTLRQITQKYVQYMASRIKVTWTMVSGSR